MVKLTGRATLLIGHESHETLRHFNDRDVELACHREILAEASP